MSAIDFLNFGPKTTDRVIWEAWEFRVVDTNEVEVTNASYGCEKQDHRYRVRIEERDGVAIPAECECPADKYNENYDCKHKAALATVGGSAVLNTARDYSPTTDSDPKVVAPDGGRRGGGLGESGAPSRPSRNPRT